MYLDNNDGIQGNRQSSCRSKISLGRLKAAPRFFNCQETGICGGRAPGESLTYYFNAGSDQTVGYDSLYRIVFDKRRTLQQQLLLLLLLLLDNVRKMGRLISFVCRHESTFHEYWKQNIIIMQQKKTKKGCPTTLSMYARVQIWVCVSECVCLYVWENVLAEKKSRIVSLDGWMDGFSVKQIVKWRPCSPPPRLRPDVVHCLKKVPFCHFGSILGRLYFSFPSRVCARRDRDRGSEKERKVWKRLVLLQNCLNFTGF